MAIKPTLQPRLSQKLSLTPQLKEAISVLQMSQVELQQFIIDEIANNPVLEHQDALDVGLDRSTEVLAAPIGGDAPPAPRGDGNAPPADARVWENLGVSKDLHEHLREQISMASSPPEVRAAADYLIGEIDDDGYLDGEPEAFADALGVDADIFRQALEVIQSCDPTGVGARSLAECLELQLRETGQLSAPIRALLDNLHLIGSPSRAQIAGTIGVDEAQLEEILATLKSLDRAPGRNFDATAAHYVTPDVFVSLHPDETWNVELNSNVLPRVIQNNLYQSKLGADETEKKFISDCMERANWLSKALDQRAKTILAVASEILKIQTAFFKDGPEFLVPLTLKDVGNALNMHESTVSRVTKGKYLQCELGIFELKFFFSGAVSRAKGEGAVAARGVQAKIRNLINAELPEKTLSDDKIAKLLGETGISIARRTVTKYREAMSIPSSIDRRNIAKRNVKIKP
jgi:RNA polymerase sigma-54 factor